MAILNLDYYTQKDHYSDGDIEDQMLEMVKKGISYEDLPTGQVEFPVIYHFSDLRNNILCWYPLKKTDRVLEIGAGCGAITGMLCEKSGQVVSVELSQRRATINYERNKNKENLTIMVGNLNDMSFDEPFDYVVVNGVLEYAMSFTQGETPYETFLKNMGQYLNDDGKILIAIENKLGLKYFAGAPEDHTDIHFFGINRYPGNHSVRTFSKIELEEILNNSGFSYQKFYYPYPDYKFPTEIFTDESLNMYGKEYPIYTDQTVQLFSESAGVKNLATEGILDRFVNSFLVVAGKKEWTEKKEIQYVKLNQERKKEFRLLTQIVEQDGTVFVEKKAMCPEAVPFLKNLKKTGDQQLPGNYENLACEYKDDAICYPFLQGDTLNGKIKKWAEKERLDKIEKALYKFYETYFKDKKQDVVYQTEEFCKVFGNYPGKKYYECIQPANVDLICANIFSEEDGKKIIDYEWVFPFPVPVAFIMWRLIHELYSRIPRLSNLYSEEQMMEKFGISYSDYEIFMQWTLHFVYEYVGSDSLDIYRKPRIPVDLSKIVKEKKEETQVISKLYYDLGEGLSEQNTIEKQIKLERNRFQVTFDLKDIQGIQGIRWNPVKGKMCQIHIDRIECDHRITLIPWGAHIKENMYSTVFLNQDPAFFLSAWDFSSIKKITFYGKMEFLDMDKVEKAINRYQKNMEKIEQENKRKEEIERENREKELLGTQQEVIQEGKKAKIKRIVKRVLGREEAVQPVEEVQEVLTACVGSSDQFHYEKNNLNLVGWAFDTKFDMENPRISFYADGKKIQEYPYIVIFRKDVAEVLHNAAAETSGFAFVASVQTPKNLQVFFEYDTEVGTGQLHLGDIPADIDKNPNDEVLIFPATDSRSLGNIRFFRLHHVREEEYIYPPVVSQTTVDIIVPVYNGLEYFDKLFAGIEKTRMPYRLIIVDDHSPDRRVKEYLEKYAASDSRVILLRNEKNMGFLPSVNRALAMAENHVALVNTDVEVPEEWLERLMLPILTREKVATSTPFTTCGTICSFPDFCEDNVIFEGMQLHEIDEVFRTVKPQYPSMPTGIGFCMGMNIQAIREIGILDEASFGKGYGEENDWCQRAIKAGYENVHVDNLFVYHKHGGSFTSEEKQRLLDKNLQVLAEKHPNYNQDTAEYCRRDPARMVRLYAIMKLLDQKLDVPTIVAFDHNLGGGATEYLVEKKRLALKEGKRFLTIRFDIYSMQYYLIYEYKNYHAECFSKELDGVLDEILRVDEIWINELVTYQNFYQVLDRILRLKQDHRAHLKMLLHDFYSICPAVNLMDAEGKYCGAACTEVCNKCIPENRSNACLDYESGTTWRHHWREFLTNCDEILAFSDDTARLFKKVYPDVYHLRVIPHKPHFLPPLNKKSKTTKTLNIGLLGVLCYKKGLDIVKQLVSYIEKENLDIRIKLIGISDEEINSNVFSCTGRYGREELPRLTLEEDIDLFLIPSIWPETFSYTASEVMSMNMPIAVFPIGAPVERVMHYKKGLILSGSEPETVIRELVDFAENILKITEMPVNNKKILFVGEEISFASRYRVEHFREQLSYQGYGSDFVQIEDIKEVGWEEYSALVFYRCSEVNKVSALTEQARKAGIAVYYNIDDLIFNYERISGIHFLKGSEYRNFEETTKNIHQCMELCDGYFTSTETLASEIRKEFPGKPVVINRNCASMEMQILSHDALEQVEKDADKIYIGYFSGSKTHDQDYEVAEEALQYVMEKYPQVYIKLVGIMSEGKLKQLKNRVEKIPFMEWQKLPGVTAGIDINLMPLEDSIFHCCKSENKWMEAALVKVPSVMSRNQEMEKVIENGKTAWLCSNTQEWIEALENLITDAKARKIMGENAYQAVMENYVTQNTGKDAREELLCSESYLK